MRLDPLHPAAWVVDLVAREGWVVHDLLAFTRSSTLLYASKPDAPAIVMKVGFGSNHVLHQMPEPERPTAYGFYWYNQLTEPERALAREDFLHERELALEASGTCGIVPVIDVGEFDGLPWYTMPPCDGGNFRTHLLAPDRPATDLEMLADAANAAAALHEHGIVHRDIYQENILIHQRRGLITDLGAAHRIGEPRGPRTRPPEPHWPPEYCSDYAAAAPAADVFSLAVLAYRFIVGDLPRLGSTNELGRIPTEARDAITRSLDHNPSARPSAHELADALKHAAHL
ncbi:protein kinase [Actinospica sp. MGRD01-02]|uniref:non-specific serine/threonine protein kinase n=1 Tax=Actinospica acidithermotolerans TaxID=2828514 RepID=A0A941EB63_9ACTN|nr:protein kinase [Actinospica acidithermotolerans]MBR7825819.1 protein kinase [Actinospica acidithermotolerans]